MRIGRDRYPQLRRRLLEPLAASRGVRFEFVSLFSFGDDVVELNDAEIAFGLLACGANALLSKMNADEFPAEGRTAKRGAKLLTKALGGGRSIVACSLLAQTQAVLAAQRQRRHGTIADADAHAACAGLVQQHYPVPVELLAVLERERQEAWEWPDELRAMEERGEAVGEHSADFLAAQRLQQRMTFVALQLVLGEWVDSNLDRMMLWPSVDPAYLGFGAADAYSWAHIEERRMRFVQAAAARSLI